MTSHDVVGVARKLFRTKRVGHTGTLDPDATGVLVLCLGNATRLAEYLSAARKHYVADVVFGIETDSQDASGQVVAERDAAHLTQADVNAILPAFRGAIQQVPPMVSALHHEGQRLYDLARQGIMVERAARAVQIDELELTASIPGAHPTARLEITCSTGTYIRSLAADIGAAAGVGGMMQTLRRTWVGEREGETPTADTPFYPRRGPYAGRTARTGAGRNAGRSSFAAAYRACWLDTNSAGCGADNPYSAWPRPGSCGHKPRAARKLE